MKENNQEKSVQHLMAYYFHFARLMRGLSQKDIAENLSKSANAVSNWELGNTSPSLDDLIALCRLLKISPNQLLGWEECPELQDYIIRTEGYADMLVELKKQKKEIEKQIKEYKKELNRKK